MLLHFQFNNISINEKITKTDKRYPDWAYFFCDNLEIPLHHYVSINVMRFIKCI